MSDARTHLGELLRLYRSVNEIDMRTLSANIGIGHATLCRIEQGKAMDTTTFLKLITWLLQPS